MMVIHRAQMLADMGVQVWYARPATLVLIEHVEPVGPAAVQSAPVQNTESVDVQIVPIALHWAKGRTGLLLFAAHPDEALEVLAADIVRALDWQYADLDQEAGPAPVLGEFKWPQLLSSTGTPARSLRALFSKHLPENGWLGLTPDAAEQVQPWLKLAPTIDVYNLVDVRSALDEPDVKRVLWQQISNH